MFSILPGRHTVNVNLQCKFFEGRDLAGCIETRVQPLFCHAAVFERAVSGLVDRDDIRTTKSKVRAKGSTLSVPLTFNSDPDNPASGASRVYN